MPAGESSRSHQRLSQPEHDRRVIAPMWISTSESLHLGQGECIGAVSTEFGHDLSGQVLTIVTKAARLNAAWAQIEGPSRR